MNGRYAIAVLPLSIVAIVLATRVIPREDVEYEPPAEMAAMPVADAYAAIEAAERRHQARFVEAADPAAAKQKRRAELAQAYAAKDPARLAEIGADLFVRDFERAGPPKQLAETTRCASCHHRGGPGGAGGLVDTYFGGRNPPALWGAGLLEKQGGKPFGRSGRWATIDEAVREMGRVAMGVELTPEETAALAAFVRSLPAPSVEPPDPARFPDLFARFTRGRTEMQRIGCTSCHVPEISLADGRRAQVYSDFKAHDMGAELADRDGRRTWTTAPLWGVAASAPWLHDGRALASLDRAILLHGGEAKSARDAYERLSPERKAEIRVFLLSLTPEPKMQVAGR